ncbi:MAG: hypothetical protein Q7K98_04475 [Candidatus Omnitrophota bacterium]|nr:hypothetical protein [Candidatus Omnitrophota bacterium]
MKKRIILGAAGLVLGLASLCFAATSIRIAATIGETHQMNVALSRVASQGATPTLVADLTGTGMDFGTLTENPTDHNFRSTVFFFIDAPVVSNKTGWTITHTATDFANSAGNNLNANTNVTFMKAVPGGETALTGNSYVSYSAAKTRAAIAQAELTGGWLRIYYGIAQGSLDAPGVNVITTAMPTGSYVGTVTLTLSP